MKSLSRQSIQRMIDGESVGAVGGGGNFDPSFLSGFAQQSWVEENFVSIEFFRRLFQAHGTENGQQTDIDPNDTDSTITSIEAMFGFWTEQYLSALGNSGGGSVSLTLANMGDVSLNNLADGQILVYDATEGKWVNTSASIVGNYLPLTGGTMTGDINFNRASLAYNSGGVIWGNRAFIGCDTSNGLGIYATRIYLRPSSSKGSSSGLGVAITSSNITYNGYTIWHEGNFMPSDYLPLTGGTLTGPLELTSGVDIRSDGYILLVYRPSNQQTISSSQWGVGTTDIQGVIRSSASDLLHWRGGGTSGQAYAILDEYNATTILNGSYLPLTGGTLSGRLTINASVADVLVLNRTSASSVVRMDLAQGGTVYGNLGLDTSHNIILRTTSGGTHTVRLQINTNGNVGIGTTSPNYKLHVNGTLGAGNTSVANLESEGYVSALSDIRKKEVVEYMDGLTIEQIASMPIIKFTWKDRPEEGLQVGSVAQEWQKILPQSVHTTHDGFLSFAESRAALVGTISNSRELMKHDARLSRIEKLLNIN